MKDQLSNILKAQGAGFIESVNIRPLPSEARLDFSSALIIGIFLDPAFIENVLQQPNPGLNEFYSSEKATDELAEYAADFLRENGYKAFAQNEKNIAEYGYFNADRLQSLLPHKTIARLAGMGWIGEDDLIVTPEYGSAISMCTVLTDMPVNSCRKTSHGRTMRKLPPMHRYIPC